MPETRDAAAGAADARGGLVFPARAQRARAAGRSRWRASISAMARGSSASTGSPTPPTRRIAQSHGLMVNYLYDLDDIEKNHEAYAGRPHRGRRPARCSGCCARRSNWSRSRLRLPSTDLPVHRHDGAAGDAVVRRGQEQDRRRDLLDLRPSAKSAFGMALRLAGVSMIEGATALTRMPSLATSSASATVSAATPVLAIV